MEEVSYVLWEHYTMIKSSNEDTPFSLTYGTEAVIPAKIGMPTLRTTKIHMVQNYEALKLNLDLLEEKIEQAAIREARSKAKMEKYYNFKVRNTSFKPGDLVYLNNDANHAEDGEKLGPKWEGPYEVTEALGKGAYKLRDRNGKLLPRTWNVLNLKKYYVHEIMELTFTMVMEMDKAVVVAVVAGTPEVLASPTKFSEDKGSTCGSIASEMDKG
ncbi:reverse transcriptase domain-containing protein [Tanacetum coccineum]|uniref:Reverse transcriptase domain-containing protein n=1 Tax=Tanacetum coccineum TaxID=301880 RepID=A0ABQ5FHS0_9ASTR